MDGLVQQLNVLSFALPTRAFDSNVFATNSVQPVKGKGDDRNKEKDFRHLCSLLPAGLLNMLSALTYIANSSHRTIHDVEEKTGGVAERLNAPVLKTGIGL